MTTRYFADNTGVGAHVNAVAGNDAWNGLYPVHIGGSDGPKRLLSAFNMDNLNAGDEVLCAMGGAWDEVGGLAAFIENPATTSMAWTNMIRFGMYDPGTGVTGKPRINTNGLGLLFNGYGGSGAPTKGGYIIEDLHIVGPYDPEADDAGITINPPLTHVIVQRCKVEGFTAGVSQRNETGGKNFYVALLDNDFTGCRLGGILGAASWNLVEGNYVHECGSLHALTHGVYYGSGVNENHAITFQHNLITNNNIDVDGTSEDVNTYPGACVGGNMTIRGKLLGVHFKDNEVSNPGGKYTTAAYGFSMFPGYGQEEYHLEVEVCRNKIQGFCSNLVFAAAPFIKVLDNDIHDNGVVDGDTPPCTGIGWSVPNLNLPDVTRDEGALIGGNTFRTDDPRPGTRGLWTNGLTGPETNSPGDDVQIIGNTFRLGDGTAGNVWAMDLTEVGTTYLNITSNNREGGNGWASAYPSLAAFEAYYATVATNCNSNNDI
jgi:hypothetical protein